jgi:hypothetical protein
VTVRAAVAGLAVLSLSACAHSIKEIAKQSSSAAVDQSVSQLTSDDTKNEALDAARDPRVEAALASMTDHVTEGILKSLESERAHKQVAALMATATRAAAQQLVATLGAEHTREQLSLLTGSMTQTALDNVGQALQSRFVPALHEALAQSASDGSPDFERPLPAVVGATARNAAFNAVLGANEGLRSSWLGDRGGLAQVQRLRESSVPWLALAFGALASLALIMASTAAIVIARARRARSEVMRLESATLLLATAMREREATGETDEIVSVVRDALQKSAHDHQRHGLLGALRLRGHAR